MKTLIFVSRDWDIQRRVVDDIRQAVALSGGSDLNDDGQSDVEILASRDKETYEAAMAEAEVFFGYTISERQLKLARNLRWVHLAQAGFDNSAVEQLNERGIVLTNSRGVHSIAVAEHAMTLALSLSRQLARSFRAQQRREFIISELRLKLSNLHGKRAIILGFGSIGKELERRLFGFGVEIWAMVRQQRKDVAAARVFSPEDWREFLPEVDLIFNLLPATAETENWIDAEKLSACKRGALLINVGRGSTVETTALLAALESGKLGGAALDVFTEEPLPEDSPLWEAPNLLLTPHVASLTDDLYSRVTALFSENLLRYLSGRELLNQVKPGQGY